MGWGGERVPAEIKTVQQDRKLRESSDNHAHAGTDLTLQSLPTRVSDGPAASRAAAAPRPSFPAGAPRDGVRSGRPFVGSSGRCPGRASSQLPEHTQRLLSAQSSRLRSAPPVAAPGRAPRPRASLRRRPQALNGRAEDPRRRQRRDSRPELPGRPRAAPAALLGAAGAGGLGPRPMRRQLAARLRGDGRGMQIPPEGRGGKGAGGGGRPGEGKGRGECEEEAEPRQ